MTTSTLLRDAETRPDVPDHEPERLPTRAGQKPIMLAITVIPFAGVITAIWLLWGSAVGVTDLVLFGSLYVLCALGITVGYHRMLTHRAFRAHPALRAVLLVFGSMAVQGNAIGWATDHRTHHAHSDKDGDPHSPHAGFASGILGQVRGLVHAHVGWMFHHERVADRNRWAKDLLDDPIIVFVDRTFVVWAVAGFALPFAIGGPARWMEGSAHRIDLGWPGTGLRRPSHHVEHQLHLPRLRAAAVSRQRPVHEQLAARPAVARRELASQPSRLPVVCIPRARPPGRRVRHLHLGVRAHRPRIRRPPRHRRTTGAQAPAGRRDQSFAGDTVVNRRSRIDGSIPAATPTPWRSGARA